VKVWKTRLSDRHPDLKMKGLLPIDRQILLQVGRYLSPSGAPAGAAFYCFQMAAMTAVDAKIMKERSSCRVCTPIGKTVALQISDAHIEDNPRDNTIPTTPSVSPEP
jgi:hypothetical protein